MTRNQLKALFETGDFPTGEDFASLIDSMGNIADDGAPLTMVDPPTAVDDPGVAGNIAEDGDYIYVYSAVAGAWRRATLSAWD